MLEIVAERFNAVAVIILMMISLFVVFSSGNFVKRLIGVSVLQTTVGLLYISISNVVRGQPPILDLGHGADYGATTIPAPAPAGMGTPIAPPPPPPPAGDVLEAVYANPLPHVLILTAIVVSVATLAVGLALVVRIREAYGSIEEDEVHAADRDAEPVS